MNRRALLRAIGCGALAACAPRRPMSSPHVRAVAFDLFTLFDPRTVDRRVAVVLGDAPGFAAEWKTRLFEYSWLRAAAGAYAPFDRLVVDSLAATARARNVTVSDASRDELVAAFTNLEPWPDTRDALQAMRGRGLRLATLANFSPSMIRALLASAQLAELFELPLSTDEARTYKPDPRAYALAERRLRLPRASIAFAAFGGWDAWGAAVFGLPTFWVQRLPGDALDAAVPAGPDLSHLIAWLP